MRPVERKNWTGAFSYQPAAKNRTSNIEGGDYAGATTTNRFCRCKPKRVNRSSVPNTLRGLNAYTRAAVEPRFLTFSLNPRLGCGIVNPIPGFVFLAKFRCSGEQSGESRRPRRASNSQQHRTTTTADLQALNVDIRASGTSIRTKQLCAFG